ncbi:MAG: DUF1559 domain-containing protein [Gemmataceae bacterium]|nr:DUF1559 domain-containing protein [Gemmataceae bacterium]
MPLRTACSSCGKKLQVRDELAGKKVKCPDCGTVFVAAGEAAAIKAAPTRPSAPPPMVKDKVSTKPMAKRPVPVDDSDDDDDVDERPARRGKASSGRVSSSGSLLWVWLALGGVLLLGGAAGAYFIFFSEPPASVPVAKKGGPPVAPIPQPPVQPPVQPPRPVGNTPALVDNKVLSTSNNLADLVPGDALFFASVSGEMWNAKGFDVLRAMFGKTVEEGFQNALGIPLADIERVSMFSVTTLEDAKKHSVGPTVVPVIVMVQAKQPLNRAVVTTALRKGDLGRNKNTAIAFVNDRTVVTSLAALVQIYKDKLGKTKASGVLERALTQASTSKGIVAAATIPPDVVALAEQGLKDAPPFFAPFLKTKSALASLEVTDKLKLQATLFMEDAAAANDAKTAADDLIGLAGSMLNPPTKDAQAVALAKAAQQALGDVKVNAQDNELVIVFETDMKVVTDAALTALKAAKGAAVAGAEMNNLKQIGLAWHNYHATYKTFPPQTVGKGLSWRVAILPFMGQDQLYRQFKLDEPWDSEHNKKLIPRMPSIYASVNAKPGFTFIQTFVGKKTINADPKKGMTFASIRDGTSNTLIVAEAAKAVEWTRPDDITVKDNEPIVLGGNPKLLGGGNPKLLGGGNPRITLAGWADGSVRRLPRDLDQNTLRLLIDPSDGMVIPNLDGPGARTAPPVFGSPPTQGDGKKPEAPQSRMK